MPTDHDRDPAKLGEPDVEDLLDLWEWVRAYRAACGERADLLLALADEVKPSTNVHLAEHLETLARLADEDRRQVDAALERYLRRSDPPWAIWQRAFGWRPGRRQIRAFLHRARDHQVDAFPVGDLAERSRHVLGVAVEHTYRFLDGGHSWDAVVEWTYFAAILFHPAIDPDPEAWPESEHDLLRRVAARGNLIALKTWPERVNEILAYREVRQCMTGGDRAPARRGPKLAACRAVALLAGPSWRACEEAHKLAKATMAEWGSATSG